MIQVVDIVIVGDSAEDVMAMMKCVKVKGAELNLWSSGEKFPQAHLEGNLTFVTMLTIFMACRILKRFSYIFQVEFNPT